MLFAFLINEGCVTKKRKKDTSKLGKFYHNMTSEFNGYFNANELMEFAMLDLQAAHVDNYTQLLELHDYVSVPDPKIVNQDMDKAIEKVTRVASLHEKGDWVDDCYVLMGKAQYLKQDYETAVETFEYFQEDFNPANPYGRNFKKKKVSAKAVKKQKKKEREAAAKAKKKEREAKEKAKKKEREKRAKEKKKRSKSKKRGKKRPQRPKKVTPKDSSKVTSPSPIANKTSTKSDKKADPKPKPQVKEPKDKSAYSEGLVWLAKSYIAAGKYTSAEFLLNRLDKETNIDNKIRLLSAVARADQLIKTNKEYQAVDYLDIAIANKKATRSEKARYAFVAGQILMDGGQFSDAKEYFNISKRKARDDKMKFMSALNGIKCDQFSGNASDNIASKLKKMLKETKYANFKDQIYFALGEVAADKKDIAKAKENFSKSIANSSGDEALKSEAYYNMATINFTLEEYADAKYYYDSTLVVMAKYDERRPEVKKLAENLTEIAKNIEIIRRLGKTVAMADMSKDELMKIAKERLEKEQLTGKATNTKVGKKGLISRDSKAKAVISDFWAYNIVSKEQGKRDFMNKWGERPLVDNWRLSSKIDNAFNIEEEEENEEEEVAVDDAISKGEYNRLMADVPNTPLAKGKLEEQIRVAKFKLGKLFRDKIQKYAKSASTLEDLNSSYGKHVDILDSYFYLYLDYQDLNELTKSNEYRDKILTEYPESKYAKLISDPSYVYQLNQDRKKLDRYYDQTYKLFEKGEYSKVTDRVKTASNNFGKDNKLIAKFTLLNAMALGYTKGQNDYIKALNEVIVRYPNTPEELKAKEIMRFLKGDKSAFSGVDIKAVDDMYSQDEKARHYVALILFDYSDDVLQPAKIAVSDYNKQFHSKDRLQMGEMLLNKTENTQLILVRSFSNQEKAMSYYEGIQNNKDSFIPEDIVSYEVLPITQQNYRKMLQQRTHTYYRSYFNKNYIPE
jgi:tetratricopeptide (TPR) repeat protein